VDLQFLFCCFSFKKQRRKANAAIVNKKLLSREKKEDIISKNELENLAVYSQYALSRKQARHQKNSKSKKLIRSSSFLETTNIRLDGSMFSYLNISDDINLINNQNINLLLPKF
jgi:hypothetical protein